MKLRFRRILMMTACLSLSAWFFSMSDHLSPFTLITIPLGIIFFSAAIGAVFGYPDRGAQMGFGVLALFLGALALTGNEIVSLAITASVVVAACALLLWYRQRVQSQ